MDQPIYTNDPMEWVEKCLHCDLDPQKCKGNCPDKKQSSIDQGSSLLQELFVLGSMYSRQQKKRD